MKIEFEVDDDIARFLGYIKKLKFSSQEIFRVGVEVINILGEKVMRKYIVDSVRKGRSYLWNIVWLGKEFYCFYVEKLLKSLGLVDSTVIDVDFTEEGCLSSMIIEPREGFKCSEIYIWNHEEPLNVVLNYTYEKGLRNVENWVKKLKERRDELIDDLQLNYDKIENIEIEIDEDDEMYYIHIAIALEEPMKINKIEDRLSKIIGEPP